MIRDDVATQIAADQGEVAEDVKDLVAGRLVAESHFVFDRTESAEDEQVSHFGA